MARVFITGSADGLGRLAAASLQGLGHEVVLHARNKERGQEALAAVPGALGVVVADFSRLAEIRSAAEEANRLGPYDAVIHNAGIYRDAAGERTAEGLFPLFVVNTLAPYLLTALIKRPKRLVYLTSGIHKNGDPTLKDLIWEKRRWDTNQAYADSKLHDAMMAFAAARLWPKVSSNTVNPGWVPTKMGGKGAPDDLNEGYRTQVWLAVSDERDAKASGRYLFHQREQPPHPAARDAALQSRLLDECRRLTGVRWPD